MIYGKTRMMYDRSYGKSIYNDAQKKHAPIPPFQEKLLSQESHYAILQENGFYIFLDQGI